MTSEQFNKSVRKTVTENLKDVRACAENQTPKPQGKMIVSWSIDTGGKVTKVSEVKNETKQPALYTCVSEKIKSWKFPEPRKNIIATVQYPFVFNMND
jgi:outer membrane biosynthesis protein TonB